MWGTVIECSMWNRARACEGVCEKIAYPCVWMKYYNYVTESHCFCEVKYKYMGKLMYVFVDKNLQVM